MKDLFKIRTALALFLISILALSCAKDSYFDMDTSGRDENSPAPESKGRLSPSVNSHVMIMISGGRNSLSSYLSMDLEELENSEIPTGIYASDDILVVLSRNGSDKTADSPAALYRVYKDHNENVIRDTLATWGGFTPIFGGNTLKDALKMVVDTYPGRNYGIVLSSHATGYLPDGYYKDPATYEKEHGGTPNSLFSVGKGYHFPPIPDYPAVKSIGQDDDANSPVEMELRAFRDAIPCRMDYILFDACLMGGVEVAYELRDKADVIGFSPTEILADGFDYDLITSRLLKDEPDPVQVCRDYFNQYTGPDGNATISAVSTEHLDALASVCRDLFEKYREEMKSVNAGKIQRYYRLERHFFYDLRDILVKSGASEEDIAALDAALSQVVIYKEHTATFLGISISDNTYSGLSMYLPSMGSAILDNFYKENLDWNTATQLVK